ncbi:MAG: methylmalonyl-CoA mutase small subunit [Prevotella sp.]|nr:methylmalonyl-CoA mutase small subunit [Prevotella sp.]
MSNNKEKLFSEFQAPTTQEWLDKIEVDLKGADFQKRLVWRTNEGFNVQPFYRREDLADLKAVDSLPGEFPFVRGNKKADNLWFVRQDIEVEDAKAANAKALDILNKGVDALGFKVKGKDVSPEFIATLLDGILPQYVELNFKTCQRHCVQLAEILVSYFKQKDYPLDQLKGSIDFDPIGKMLCKGKDTTAVLQFAKPLIEALKELPGYKCINVNSVKLNNAGAYIYQELGYALAWGAEYLNLLTEAGVDATEAAKRIKFNMGVSENYFMEIAKFRAARLLWAQIVKQFLCDNGTQRHEDTKAEDEKLRSFVPSCSLDSCQMHVCAITSEYNQTLFDSYVNLLRSQTETMSAAIANVDSIIVTPFDKPYEQPTEFAERIARNQQLLLKEEAHFDKLVDVSGGSYTIEHLTDAIAKEGWKLFLAVEEAGGFLAETLKGNITNAVNASNDKRHAAAATRREFILGTNQFPNFTEKSDGKQPLGPCVCCGSAAAEEPALPLLNKERLASEFETLRLSTEKAAKQPIAFMLTIGNLAMRQARAQFSCNFLAAAGYKVMDNLGFKTVEEGVDAALEAKADIVVICSSDDEYAEYAIPAFKYLDGRAMYVVAGAPACSEDLKAAGIENFIHVKSNQLETLKEYNQRLGI